jgi:hypothetical protein
VNAGHWVRYFTADDIVDTRCRGLADTTGRRVIDTLLRADLLIVDEGWFAPLDETRHPVTAALRLCRRRSLCVFDGVGDTGVCRLKPSPASSSRRTVSASCSGRCRSRPVGGTRSW